MDTRPPVRHVGVVIGSHVPPLPRRRPLAVPDVATPLLRGPSPAVGDTADGVRLPEGEAAGRAESALRLAAPPLSTAARRRLHEARVPALPFRGPRRVVRLGPVPNAPLVRDVGVHTADIPGAGAEAVPVVADAAGAATIVVAVGVLGTVETLYCMETRKVLGLIFSYCILCKGTFLAKSRRHDVTRRGRNGHASRCSSHSI